MNTFTCFICGNIKPKQKDGGTGYAINSKIDVWFFFDFQIWNGYSIGDNTQICHCKRTKKMVV